MPYILRDRLGGEARDVLRSHGCLLGRIRHQTSRTVGKGRVISQRPEYNVVLPAHGRVDVVVSRGRRPGHG